MTAHPTTASSGGPSENSAAAVPGNATSDANSKTTGLPPVAAPPSPAAHLGTDMRSPSSAAAARPGRLALIAWLVRRTRSLLPPLGIATAARILGDLLGVAILVAAAIALTRQSQGDTAGPWGLILTIAGLAAARAGLRYLEHYAGHWVAFSALHRLRMILFNRLIPQAPAATTGHASAEITERATRDIDKIEVFFAHTIPPVIASVLVPAAALSWLAIRVDPLAAGLVACFLTAALLLPFLAARSSWSASREELAARGALATHVSDDIQGLREVLAFEAQEQRLDGLRSRERRVAAAQLATGRARGLREAAERLLWLGALVSVLLCELSAPELIVSLALLVGLWLGGSGTDDFATGLDAALTAADRVRTTAEAEPAVVDSGSRALASGSRGGPASVTFEGVGFSYPLADAAHSAGDVTARANTAALTGLDLAVAAGDWHHLVGISGSGKSTVASLLHRVWDPDAGRILINGVPISELPLAQLRRLVAVVPQRPQLFSGTLADNLRLANPDAPEARLNWALHVACLDGDHLPDGLETRIGERGTTLSGGQLQRAALARALVMAPSVLVLDESLSQLDADTAATVRERLASEVNVTILEVTHRADLLAGTASVTVLDRGRIVEEGTAAELLSRDGAFVRLRARF